MARFLGLDIGGANIKISDGESRAKSLPFPLWKTPDLLAETLRNLVGEFPAPEGFAVTMTGELADCFTTKAEGVDCILSAMQQAADNRPLTVWQTGAEFVPPAVAREIPLLVAAANWHALATFVGRMVPSGLSLLIDIGSTTTDIIPLLDGVPIPTGMTDRERLIAGELVYTGTRRTPLCAVAKAISFHDALCPLAAELFATTLDVYLILGIKDEDETNCDTANNRPATKAAAQDRLARMLCCDTSEISWDDAVNLAQRFAAEQRQQIRSAVERVLSQQSEPLSHVLISGSGNFLAEQLCREVPVLQSVAKTSLAEIFRGEIADAACAFAVARLASERVSLG